MRGIKALMVLGAVAAIGLAPASRGELLIDWTNPNGYWDNTDTGVAAGTTGGGGIWGMLILLQPGESPLEAAVGNLTGNGSMPIAEGDLVPIGTTDDLAQGNSWGYGAVLGAGPSPFVPGSQVFARVFQAADTGSIVEGTWYYDGPVVPVQDIQGVGSTPPPTPQVYNANRDLSGQGFGDALNTGQVVPEPGTLALLLIGAATAVWRRRR